MRNYQQKLEQLNFDGKILFDEPLKDHTTMKVGGKARIFVLPENEESVLKAVKTAKEENLKFFVFGGGSNLIFSDDGFDGVVICTENMSEINILEKAEDNEIYISCRCGTKTSSISDFCLENNISGFEAFAGLPGSVGGAVFMNARCYDDEISKHVKIVDYLDLKKLEICRYEFDCNDWSYKISPFQDGEKIVMRVVLSGLKKQSCGSEIIKQCKEKAAGFVKNRDEKGHFKYPSAGSVFKNNHAFGKPSGVLVDEAGLKGLAVGGAQVAPWHGNFIINNENATASDIKELVKQVQEAVKEKTGFMLEPEIIFVD